ncbi:MAG TPA: hypothetical protein V6C84_28425 [Coleofasciculaceae cyanobacterium]|jgi:ATP-dependent Lhr-like helicase
MGCIFHHDWKIAVNNSKLKIKGDSLGFSTLSGAIDRMCHEAFWQNKETQHFILSQLPEYRLSKFQQALPEIYSLEMVSNYLLDTSKTSQFLQAFDH